MHAAPAGRGVDLSGLSVRFLYARVLGEALAETDERGDGDDEGDPEGAAAAAIGRAGGAVLGGEEHAETDEEVAENFGVTRQRVREEDVAEFPVGRFCDAADGDALQGGECAVAAVAADKGDGHDEADDEDDEVEVGEDLPCGDVGGAAICEAPEEEEREEQRDGEREGNAVAGEVVRWVVRGVSRGVSEERGDVYADEGEVVKVEAPCPYACALLLASVSPNMADGLSNIPITMIRATRYGRGSMRLNLSSSGSTAGSPSILKSPVAFLVGRNAPQHLGLRSHKYPTNE